MKYKYVVSDTSTTDEWVTIPSMCVIPINAETKALLKKAKRILEYMRIELGDEDFKFTIPFPAAWLDEHPAIKNFPEVGGYYVLETDEEIDMEPSELKFFGSFPQSDAVVVRVQEIVCESCFMQLLPPIETEREYA